MTNPIINPQPNYSGVTIQISNPAVNVGNEPNGVKQGMQTQNANYCTCPQCHPFNYYNDYNYDAKNTYKTIPVTQNPTPQPQVQNAYPAQYYLNNYNYQTPTEKAISQNSDEKSAQDVTSQLLYPNDKNTEINNFTPKDYEANNSEVQDFTKSQAVIDDLNTRAEAMEKEKKNTKQKRIVALTDEYIKSLENYLDNPDSEIRLMASKEILTRLDEDKDRYNDAALNALLNKMLQDPSKLIRVAALSAFASRLASGNDYTVQLLQNIQSNPSADKEDILQASDILLKMSSITELKNVPYDTTQKSDNITKEKEEKLNIEPINRFQE